jgi:S1-C subfamily serine protease
MKRVHFLFLIFTISLSSGFAKSRFLNPSQVTNEDRPINFSELLESEKNTVNIFKTVAPSVVNVSSIALARRGFFDMDRSEVPRGAGTGWVWNDEGYIITNFHVVQQGQKFKISFQNDKEQYDAEVVGVEPSKDVAVLKLKKKPKNLIPAKVGSSKGLMVGQKTVAIGNPFGLDHTMTTGIVSATGRSIEGIGGVKIRNMIQTDASINPGNSGGPLLNSKGQVIGMNTMIFSNSGSSAGVGFAVPVDEIKRVVPEIIEFGKVTRPALGVIILEDQYAQFFGLKKGIAIRTVVDGSAAERAGFRGMTRDRRGRYSLGDVILRIDKHEINSFDDIYHALGKYKPGDTVTVTYDRNGKDKKTKLKLQENR